MGNLEKFLIEEMNRHSEYLNEQDIAKFIIQAHSGPFHLMREAPNEHAVKKGIIREFKANKSECRERDIFQQISEHMLRLHIVPFIRKYRTADTCTGMFMKNFEHYDIVFNDNISLDETRHLLSSVGILETDTVMNMIDRYNNEGFVPSHSDEYKGNYHPAYIVILNDVIKEYITSL